MHLSSRVRAAAVLVGCCLLSACAALQTGSMESSAQSVEHMTLRAQYIDQEDQVVPSQYQPQAVVFSFPYIPGKVFGRPSAQPVFMATLKLDDTVRVDLKAPAERMHALATRLSDGAYTEGLVVQPAETRFARMGTFPYDAKTMRSLGGGGLREATSNDGLILMYFDRPCELTGQVMAGEDEVNHVVRIPSAGFHWIRMLETGEKQAELSRADGIGDVIFTIILTQLNRT